MELDSTTVFNISLPALKVTIDERFRIKNGSKYFVCFFKTIALILILLSVAISYND
jgi:hypothetical protein